MITYDVNLCIGTDSMDKRLVVKCHDTGVNLRVHLLACIPGKWRDDFVPYSIPAGSTAVLKIVKPDKKYCITEGNVGSNDILFEMHPQAFTVAGVSKAEVSLFGPNGKRISSATFHIDIPEECICGCDIESENYIDVMSEQIRAAIDAANRAEAAVTHGPIIQDGSWWLWNPETEEYEDSGVATAPEVSAEDIENAVNKYLEDNPVKAFDTDETLTLKDGVLSVNTTDQMEKDNTLPMTSAGVYATVGNIEALLKTI